MKFNQELITKAQKGEVAILNDGSVEELLKLLIECWPEDDTSLTLSNLSQWKYYFKASYPGFWGRSDSEELPAHSVKDFYMDTNKLNVSPQKQFSDIVDKESAVQKPRTYKVTRQQMKEIWEAAEGTKNKGELLEMAAHWLPTFGDEINIDDAQRKGIFNRFVPPYPEILKEVFKECFFIPEGEPVLVRNNEGEHWQIMISDGKGQVYNSGFLEGRTVRYYQLIPFTKNPPK